LLQENFYVNIGVNLENQLLSFLNLLHVNDTKQISMEFNEANEVSEIALIERAKDSLCYCDFHNSNLAVN
jgi:hypothetical protein